MSSDKGNGREDDLDRELRAHLELEAEEQREAGLSAHEAGYAAQRVLGNSALIRERTREMWGWSNVERFWQDVKYAARTFRRSPGFVAVAVLSLALGIGASTALFSVIYGVLIAPYPYAKPGEIWAPAVVGPTEAAQNWHQYSRRELTDLQKVPAFSAVMATDPTVMLLGGDRGPESEQAVRVSGNAFDFLGVKPILGRAIEPYDIGPGGQPAPVAVASYGFWQRVFGGQPNIIGARILLDEIPHTIIGVMPQRFGWWTSTGFWVPLSMDLKDENGINVIMRLASGVTPQAAAASLQQANLQLAEQQPKHFPKGPFRSTLLNYLDITSVSDEMVSSLHLLFAAVGFLLLIACANVANLQLARTTVRLREIAVRLSIGANRGRIVRQLLTESVLLSVAGGVAGVGLAIGLTRGIAALMPTSFIPNEARIEVNISVLLFSLGVSVLTGIVFGLAPAIHCSRPNLTDALKEGSRGGGSSATGGRLRSVLVIAEVTLSVVLLAGATLSVRGFANLLETNPGFQPDRTMIVNVALPPRQYKTIEQRNILARTLLERVSRMPGVESASIGNGTVMNTAQTTYSIDGAPAEPSRQIRLGVLSADYSRTLGIPLKRGRMPTEDEIDRGAHVAVINETAARLWPAGEDPIGRQITLNALATWRGSVLLPPAPSGVMTVVGILGDVRNMGLRNQTAPAAMAPYTLAAPPVRELAIRARGTPMALLNSVRAAAKELDPRAPIERPITLDEMLGNETVQPRFTMALLGFFAGLGILLAAAGIYSVISCDIAQKTHEIGVRVALGASKSNIVGMVLGKSARMVGIGLAAGLAGAITLERLARFEFFGAVKLDWISALVAISALALVGLIAAWTPARRASKMHPLDALRYEA